MQLDVPAGAELAPAAATGPARGRLGGVSNPVSMTVAVAVVALTLLAAAFPSVLSPSNPLALHQAEVLRPPGAHYLLGTDEYGRSILAQLIYGARGALAIGFFSVLIGAVLGGAVGTVAGFYGGLADGVAMRVIDVLMCFPGVLLALVIAAGLGPSLVNEIIAVGVSTVPGFARVARGQVLQVRGRLYVEAAVTSGLTRRRVIARHVLPNAAAPLLVLATVSLGTSVVLGASLSFLGLGPVNGVPDWGQLLANGESYLGTAWWMSTFPGLLLTVLVVAVNVIGDWLRDKMDVAA